MVFRGILIAVAFFCCWLSAANAADPVVATTELDRTFEAARVYLPGRPGHFRKSAIADLFAGAEAYASRASGIVFYAHGCDGLSRITDVTGAFLARAGYIVIAPDSFARRHKPVSCAPYSHRAGLHREVLGWRQSEIRHAFRETRAIPRIAELPVFLMGHSEGAITVATIDGLSARARIIEGWTCHAGWPEYRGLSAPAGQPVLSLVGADDPWFRLPPLRGDCGAFMARAGRHQSVVYRAPDPLHDDHWLSWNRSVQGRILAFLEASRR